jgi:hypothetical protein
MSLILSPEIGEGKIERILSLPQHPFYFVSNGFRKKWMML